jgi:hypothetical protein
LLSPDSVSEGVDFSRRMSSSSHFQLRKLLAVIDVHRVKRFSDKLTKEFSTTEKSSASIRETKKESD